MSQSLSVSPTEQVRSPAIPFSSLPVEIRTCVWEFVSFLPRNLDIWGQLLGTLENDYTTRKQILAAPFKYRTTRSVPAILHVNRESRLIGLKHYFLEFSWEMKDAESGLEMKVAPRIYYNPQVDRVCLMGSFVDPIEYQGSSNTTLPWSLYTPRFDQTSLAPTSFAINLWPIEHSYGYYGSELDGHMPAEFGFIVGLLKVKEILLFWESGVEVDEDNILLGNESFDFVEVAINNMEGERWERLEAGRALLEREFQQQIDDLRNELARGHIRLAEFEERLAHLEVRPVVRLVRLMAGGEFPPDPKC